MNNKSERSDNPLPREFKNPPGTLPDGLGESPSLPETVVHLPKVLNDTISLRNGATNRA